MSEPTPTTWAATDGTVVRPADVVSWLDTLPAPIEGVMLLGRDAASSPFSALFADRDNISRRHASVWVHADGAAWVRDERSTNGTYVNDMQIALGTTAALADGDELRLASDVTARIELNRGGSG